MSLLKEDCVLVCEKKRITGNSLLCLFGLILLFFFLSVPVKTYSVPKNIDFSKSEIRGIRFDPSFYYDIKQPLNTFVDSIVGVWASNGINCVFFLGYDPQFGAFYRTSYPGTIVQEYGQKNLMARFATVCHARGLRFIVWLWPFKNKQAWDKYPQWRIKNKNGEDFQPSKNDYHLCVRNTECQKWWDGFVGDLLANYPEIDGIDLAEPAVVFNGRDYCQCSLCKTELGQGALGLSPSAQQKRAQGLTKVLNQTSKQIHAQKKISCLTFTATANELGHLLPFSDQIAISGLDMDAILNSRNNPDWVSVELLWQQWAHEYNNQQTFHPDWTCRATSQAVREIRNRALFIAHIELSHFGDVPVDRRQFMQSLSAIHCSGDYSFEFYDAHLADSMSLWPLFQKSFNEKTTKRRTLVLYDSADVVDANATAEFCGHFDTHITIAKVNTFDSIAIQQYDYVLYIGGDTISRLPASFLSYAEKPLAPLLWINLNIDQLFARPALQDGRYGFRINTSPTFGNFRDVVYKSQKFSAKAAPLKLFMITDTARVTTHAWAISSSEKSTPYIIQSKNLWAIANGNLIFGDEHLHYIFADILHIFFNELHPESHQALVRIEDITPQSDPEQLRKIADYLAQENIPWSIALVPFYYNPKENISSSLSSRKDLLAAVKYCISKGAAIVQHGVTHQYRGISTNDYEFWDIESNFPIFEDSRKYVASRIQRGLDEMHKNELYPVVYEMPHYAASEISYQTVNEFYSTQYGRCEVPGTFYDYSPFFIKHHPITGGRTIPENCGYVPNYKQDAQSILEHARLAYVVNDGFASFFFHAWIDMNVLKQIVTGIKELGYQFNDIRNIPMSVTSKDFVQCTGTQQIKLKLRDQYLHTFYIDNKGKKQYEYFSEETSSGIFTQHICCPPGWTYVAEGTPKKSLVAAMKKVSKEKIEKLTSKYLKQTPPLLLQSGNPGHVAILWKPDSAKNSDPFHTTQYAWKHAFEFTGIPVETLDIKTYAAMPPLTNLLIVPSYAAKRLTPQQCYALSREIASGKNILLEGSSLLSDTLGIHAGSLITSVDSVYDKDFPNTLFAWKKPELVTQMVFDQECDTHYVSTTGVPVVMSTEYGKGSVLYFGSHVASAGESEPTRFPFLSNLIQRTVDIHPVVRAPLVEVYHDPVFNEFISQEAIVTQWRKSGVKIAHIAFSEGIGLNTNNYINLVDLCHRNGILAYAWFAFPRVGRMFWEAHPKWHETNAAGIAIDNEANNTVNLLASECRKELFDRSKTFMTMADWDGVNWTGGVFTGDTTSLANQITPMDTLFRTKYRKQFGYDPKLIFDKPSPVSFQYSPKCTDIYFKQFFTYRDSLEYAITQEIMEFFTSVLSSKKDAELIVSKRLDNVYPKMLSYYKSIIEDQPTSKICLQAQLPRNLSLNRIVFDSIVSVLKSQYAGWHPMVELDLETLIPLSGTSSQLCGTELFGVCSHAAKQNIRLTFRTRENIYDIDFYDLSYALASATSKKIGHSKWKITTKNGLLIDLDPGSNPLVKIDGELWPVYFNGRVFFPSGTHTIESCSKLLAWEFMLKDHVHISEFSGNVISASSILQGVVFRYNSEKDAFLNISQIPLHVTVDGYKELSPLVSINIRADKQYESKVFKLPAGNHSVRVVAETFLSSLTELISLNLSLIIVIIGIIANLVFLFIYGVEHVQDYLSSQKRKKEDYLAIKK